MRCGDPPCGGSLRSLPLSHSAMRVALQPPLIFVNSESDRTVKCADSSPDTREMIAYMISFIFTPVGGDEESRCQLNFFSRRDTETSIARLFSMFVYILIRVRDCPGIRKSFVIGTSLKYSHFCSNHRKIHPQVATSSYVISRMCNSLISLFDRLCTVGTHPCSSIND